MLYLLMYPLNHIQKFPGANAEGLALRTPALSAAAGADRPEPRSHRVARHGRSALASSAFFLAAKYEGNVLGNTHLI